MQKKFCLKYIQCFDAKEAAIYAGYHGACLNHPIYRILRKVSDVTDYLIAKQDLYSQIVKKEWVMTELIKLYDTTANDGTKLQCLEKLSKILQMQNEATKIEVNNNIPQTPVTINFTKEDTKDDQSV